MIERGLMGLLIVIFFFGDDKFFGYYIIVDDVFGFGLWNFFLDDVFFMMREFLIIGYLEVEELLKMCLVFL